jgi:hypothetical protein
MGWIQQKRERAHSFYQRHEKTWPILFFIGGFLFDLVMLGRIDAPEVWAQQFVYIVGIAWMLSQMLREEITPLNFETMGRFKKLYYHHRLEIMHFFFGTLLNAYTIFYFKSASLITSFGFLIVLCLLLFVNELPQFRSKGTAFKFALLALCVYSFFSYILPIAVGYMSGPLFFFSLLIGYLPFVFASWWTQKRSPVIYEMMKMSVILPSTLILAFFMAAYWLRIIPPAPLSIPFIGVYHSVDRTSDGYKLGHEQPWWKFWQEGDQDFVARPGDKVYVFFRIFSPTRFSDQVMIAWVHKDPKHGWREEDRVPIKIVGGRKEGFRGFGRKANYEPGEWRAQIETTDGREIGRIYFDLELAPEQTREFEYDTQ